MITTSERDFLEQDVAIRNQNFACLSFVSPEELIKKKDIYFFEKYIETFSSKVRELKESLEEQFPEKKHELRVFSENYDFVFDPKNLHQSYTNFIKDKEDVLTSEFDKENDFQTNVRGIKIRGVYDTLKEAEYRSTQLRKLENNKFSIYIAQVGCWCPWYPNPDDVESQEYSETELNTLMSKYDENIQNKDQFFTERKQEMKTRLEEERKQIKDNNVSAAVEVVESNDNTLIDELVKDDPWTKVVNEAKEEQ